VDQGIEHLPSKCETLSQIPALNENERDRENEKERFEMGLGLWFKW
jgi:hypothetical protein